MERKRKAIPELEIDYAQLAWNRAVRDLEILRAVTYDFRQWDLDRLGEQFSVVRYMGGNYKEALEGCVKLTTVRGQSDKYSQIESGQLLIANCVDEKEVVPLIEIQTFTAPLKEIDPILLALDGFANVEEAVARLGEFYPNFSVDSMVTVMFQISAREFVTMNTSAQKKLLSMPLRKLIKERQFREIFWTALVKWTLHKAKDEAPEDEWIDNLVKWGLITKRREEILRKVAIYSGYFDDLLNSPDSDVYRRLILGL